MGEEIDDALDSIDPGENSACEKEIKILDIFEKPKSENVPDWVLARMSRIEFPVLSSDSEDEGPTPEEWRKYNEQLIRSDGFDVGSFHAPYVFGMIKPVRNLEDYDVNGLALAGLEWFNISKNEAYVFSKVLKANSSGGLHYYITFEAKNSDGMPVIFQALVCRTFTRDRIEVRLCRIKWLGKRKRSEEIFHSMLED